MSFGVHKGDETRAIIKRAKGLIKQSFSGCKWGKWGMDAHGRAKVERALEF